jgi:Zn-dependent metalloprotease
VSGTLRSSCCVLLIAIALAGRPASALAQGRPTALSATRADADALRGTDELVDSLVRSRALRLRASESDPLVAERRHERFDQYHRGVRIVGGDVTRQSAANGTVSVFGMLHSGVDIDVDPALSLEQARQAIAAAVSGRWMGDGDPELVVLPLSDGYHLAYGGRAATALDVRTVYVDARSGARLQDYSEFTNEVGTGKGAYGDDKKVSARASSGTFLADDPLRPAAITTYDMKGNLARTMAINNRQISVATSDIGADADNVWTDPTVVDAHVYAGWYYDYLFKRFGRRGLDGNNLRMAVLTHPVRQQDIAGASNDVIGLYYINAFFCGSCGPDGRGTVTLGEGAPRNFFEGVEVKPFSAAFDVVAHELTHGVTANSARLNGFPYSEAGALNEAFSDIVGASAAFFQLPAGTAPMTASYLTGRDLTVPAGLLSRSMANPASTRDPDFYAQRNIGGDPHFNGTIVTHAFYLAIEGGTNRTSGLSVAGVGAANREQIEKAFFRALTVLMPSSSTFALARQATIQAARDLYGAGSAPERAITQAWDAVGVQDRIAPTAAVLPNPAPPTTASCGTGIGDPHWVLGITVSAGASSLQVSQWSFDLFDHNGTLRDHEVFPGAAFAAFFNQCGPGSARVIAQADACTAVCTDVPGDTAGAAQLTVVATDEAGRTVTFSSPRTALVAR